MLCRAGCLESRGLRRYSSQLVGLESPINQMGKFFEPESLFIARLSNNADGWVGILKIDYA